MENFKYINLNVLKTFKRCFPNVVLGLSDHTPGHSTVLGAISLGAKIIEKHFTDNNNLSGPDHSFSMDPKSWKEMVERTRELESSLGNDVKEIELNELKLQYFKEGLLGLKRYEKRGNDKKEDLIMLRPCPEDAIPPFEVEKVLGLKPQRLGFWHSNKMERSELAILIPALNESKQFFRLFKNNKFGIPIVIDDGSIDKTYSMAKKAGANLIKHKKNLGYDQSLNSGFKMAL